MTTEGLGGLVTAKDSLRRHIPLAHDVRIDLYSTLSVLSHGRSDHTMFLTRDGIMWRATRTPDGVATICVRPCPGGVVADAWGEGAGWVLDHVPDLIGMHDDHRSFAPRHELLRELQHRHPGLRIPRTHAVFEAVFPAILEQKVTGLEAHRSLRVLQSVLCEPAPGPAGPPSPTNGRPPGLVSPPDPAVVESTPSHVFHRAGVERKRGDTIRRAAAYAHRLEECTTMTRSDAYRRLQALPGLGAWTAAEVALVAFGDADAVSVGDYHLKNQVSWAFAGEARGTDERMLELLEPFRPHRGRVLRLLSLGGIGAPRFGPRLTVQTRW